MLIQGNSVQCTDIVDIRSKRSELAKGDLITLLSLPKNQTFISPDKLIQLNQYSSNFFKWHKHSFSGRSFSKGFTHEGQLYDLIVKGGHLLEKGEVRLPPFRSTATPAWGSETVKQLYSEFDVAYRVQQLFQRVRGEYAPLPIPLKVSRLDLYTYEGEVEKYKDLMNHIFSTFEGHERNMMTLLAEKNAGTHEPNPKKPGCFRLKKKFDNFPKLLEVYWKEFGDHGTYQYVCQGTTMRLADVFKAPTRAEMQRIIRSFYPHCTDEKICETFMNNLGKARGAISGAGYNFMPGTTRISNCYLVDTTIMGNAMDIDGYTFHKKFNEDRFREMCQKHWLYGEISYLFYSIFFAEDFFDFYREHFVTPHVKTYLDVLDHRMGVNIDKQERKNVEKVVAKPFYQEATRRVRKNVIPKKNLRSAKKYLGNILDCIE